MDIRWHENLGLSAAWEQVPAYMQELQRDGIAERPGHGPAWNDAAMVAYGVEPTLPVGWLAYRPNDYVGSWWIVSAYVLPSWRGKGVHTALFEALVKRAQERGDILSIQCGTSVNNVRAQKAFERQGRELVGYQYRYVVKEWLDGAVTDAKPE